MIELFMFTVDTLHVYHCQLIFITSLQMKPVADGGLLPRAERQNRDSRVEMRASGFRDDVRREETVEK